jgi:dihydropteroate synthase
METATDWLACRREQGRPAVMGIINVTPDSFSDGGLFFEPARALDQGLRMAFAGADIIDVGGESTRPGARPISPAEEMDRVLPVIEGLRARVPTCLSVDTSTPEVMTEAVAAGARIINDVRALQRPGALEAALSSGAQLCLMHMQGEPGTMQQRPYYDNVVAEVVAFLSQRIEAAVSFGIARDRLIVDPGFGFGKNLEHNLALLRHLDSLGSLGVPVLAGLSRKSMIVRILGHAPESRMPASLALALAAARRGVSILRVHDVGETVDALRIWQAVESGQAS